MLWNKDVTFKILVSSTNSYHQVHCLQNYIIKYQYYTRTWENNFKSDWLKNDKVKSEFYIFEETAYNQSTTEEEYKSGE